MYPPLDPFLKSLEKAMNYLGVPDHARLLLGVSGGMDSMVLLHALLHFPYSIEVAHVNFKLRGAESDEEAQFVQSWCEINQVPFHLLETDTLQVMISEKLNKQMAARKIRYTWWDKLRTEHSFDYVVTAHQLDDQVETFMINLLRGTGMKGLTGIPDRRTHLIRPLLTAGRNEIETYATHHQVPYKTDSSNLEDDYLRNRIRHHLIPLMNDLITGFPSRMQHNLHRIQKEWKAWESAYAVWEDRFVSPQGGSFALQFEPAQEGFILRWLEEKGFPWNLSLSFLEGEGAGGHVLQKSGYRLSRTSKGYFLEEIKEAETYKIPEPGTYYLEEMVFTIYPVDVSEIQWQDDPNVEFLSVEAVNFPLEWRPVQAGDVFQPLGMRGHQKKIQDLLVDRKLEQHEKTRVRLLTNLQHILWVSGIQLDERAKLQSQDKMAYRVSIREIASV